MNIRRQKVRAMLAIMLAIAGCVREEEALTDSSSGPIGGDAPPSTLTVIPPPDSSDEATGPTTTVDMGQATATGGDGDYRFSHDAPIAGFQLGLTTVTWTVTDGTGATASDTQAVTIVDTTPPALQPPADLQVAAAGSRTMVDIGSATAADLVDLAPLLVNDMPGNGFPEGTTPVTWTATDSSGNSTDRTQMITVSAPSSGALTLTAPADISSEATARRSSVMLGAAMASGGQPPITIENNAPAAGFDVGTTTVTWTATDAAMTVATALQQVRIADTTPPQLSVPADVTANQAADLGKTDVPLGTATATDIADPSPVIFNDAPPGGFPVGTTRVTWTAQDENGNSTTATQGVTVNPFAVEQCSELAPDFATVIYPILDSTDPLRCNDCHTGSAPLATPNGFAFPNEPPTAEDLEVFRTIALIDSGNESLVTAKARGGAAHAGGDRFPDGLDDPDYARLVDFVARARACRPDQPGGDDRKIVYGSGYEQLYRITTALASRVPKSNEVALVAGAQDQEAIDDALDAIMDGLMREDAFYTRIREIYNDLLLTDKDAGDRGEPGTNFDLDAFANRGYYAANFTGDLRSDLHEFANYGLARAPVELVAWVIENERPFTEILTADYVMVNPYSAVIYGVDAGDPSFPFSSDNNRNNHDRNDFRPVTRLVQQGGNVVPVAGVIGTHAFLARYPSTNTNVNRKRARFVFDYFLGVDIEGLASRDGLDLNNVVGVVPTYEDPQCTVCHNVMDPVAGLFTKRQNAGEYDRGRTFRHNRSISGVPRMVPAGYSMDPADVLPTAEEHQPLKWMARRLATDPRFADRTVRTVLQGLTGIESTTPATTAFVNRTKNAFVASNFDFKAMLKSIVLSDYFRARNLAAGESPSAYSDVGAGRILTPEELHRRISAVAGGSYVWRGPNSNSGLTGRHYMLYGGIDSDQIVTRTTEPNSLMDGIQERIANQVACERVADDLYNDGVLFPHVDATDTPDDAAGRAAIRRNIAFLHRRLLGEDLAPNDAEVSATYGLFVDVRAASGTTIPGECRGGGGANDVNGTVLPWMAVVTYLLSDYHFLYQ